MNKSIKLTILAFFLLFFAGQAHAAAPQWKIDPAHSGFYFGIDHIFSTVRGFFEEFEGTTHFDRDNLDESSFNFKVTVNTINTHNRKRDGHLRSDDFFSAKEYPYMSFKSTKISHLKGNQYLVQGKMTLKDVTKDVEIPFTFFGIKDNPFNPKEQVAGFESQFTIDRMTYNVGNGKFLKLGVVGQNVDVLVTMEMVQKK